MMGKMASRLMPGMKGALKEKNAMVEKLHASGKLDNPGQLKSGKGKNMKRKKKAERQRRKKGRR